jgi:hypothetical protein
LPLPVGLVILAMIVAPPVTSLPTGPSVAVAVGCGAGVAVAVASGGAPIASSFERALSFPSAS